MRRFLVPFLILAAACASQPGPQQQQIAPVKIGEYNPDSGPEPVGVIPTATIRDARRNKDLEVSIEYPTRAGTYPVVIFSHGYGTTSQSYEPLASYWTSNGCVVIRPTHADAGALRDLLRDPLREIFQQGPQTQQERDRQRQRPAPTNQPATPPSFRPNPMETIWEKEREPQWRDRALDIRLVLDSLGDLEMRFPELRGKMDRGRIGVAGHSYGAFTAMLLAGARVTGLESMADPRVRAALIMSPQGVAANRGLTQQSWADIRIPVAYMTGSEDRGALEGEGPEWRKQAFELSREGDKFLIFIKGARHSSFLGITGSQMTVVDNRPMPTPANPGGYSQQQPNMQQQTGPAYYGGRNIFSKIKITSQIFWDGYLRGDETARDLLQPDKISSAAPGVEITRK